MTTDQRTIQPGVAGILDQLRLLRGLVDAERRAEVDELLRRWQLRRFRVLVVGEAKRGKSTVINAVLGRSVLPMGVIPVTAVTTTVAWGRPERIIVHDQHGRDSEHDLAAVSDFVAEEHNPHNRRQVREVTVLVDHPLLAGGLELVDTPGTGSSVRHDAEAAQALHRVDAAILVLTADPPISTSEHDLLQRVRESSVRTFVLLNKVDYVEQAERERVFEFVARSVTEGGQQAVVYACSARSALAGDPQWAGLGGFAAAFDEYLATASHRDLTRSISRRGRNLALSALDGIRMGERLLSLQADERAATLEGLRRGLAAIDRRQRQSADLAQAGVRHLIAETDEAAQRTITLVTTRLLTDVQAHLDHDLGAVTNAEVRSAGRAYAAEQVRSAVDTWRTERQRTLESGLRELEQQLLADLDSILQELRSQVRSLLAIDLVAAPDDSRLVPEHGFFYQLAESPAWESPFTVLHEHLPGRAGRRRAVAWVRSQTTDLVAQQVGRVRGDLQYRLEESGRALGRAIDGRYAAATSAARTALRDAGHKDDHDAVAAAPRQAELAQRREALSRLAQSLTLACDEGEALPFAQAGPHEPDECQSGDAGGHAG